MAIPENFPVVDLCLNIPGEDNSQWFEFIRPLLMDKESRDSFKMPAQYLFKNIPNITGEEDFIAYTESKNVRIFGIGYASKSDQIAYFPYKNGVSYFGLDEINWYGKPINPVVIDFQKRKYDILLDLSQSDIFPVHYIFAISSAKFKITNDGIKAKYADFVLQLENSEKLSDYISQIKHYLEAIQIK